MACLGVAPSRGAWRAGRRGDSAVGRRRGGLAARAEAEAKAEAKAATTFAYTQLSVDTLKGMSVHDVTQGVRDAVRDAGVTDGFVVVTSRHTTTALCVNENEARLVDDIRQFLPRLVPPDFPYLHNDIHLRFPPEGSGWETQAWRDQEPVNAHAHLLAMLVGSSETIPVSDGELTLGTWQSILLLELDGPRTRTVGVQVVGNNL